MCRLHANGQTFVCLDTCQMILGIISFWRNLSSVPSFTVICYFDRKLFCTVIRRCVDTTEHFWNVCLLIQLLISTFEFRHMVMYVTIFLLHNNLSFYIFDSVDPTSKLTFLKFNVSRAVSYFLFQHEFLILMFNIISFIFPSQMGCSLSKFSLRFAITVSYLKHL